MGELFRVHYINGYTVHVFGYNPDTEQIDYETGNRCRRAKKHYVCPWGGNPYPGTVIEYYNIILPNGKRARLTIRA